MPRAPDAPARRQLGDDALVRALIRSAAPYVHAFRGKTFVIAFGGEVVADDEFLGVVHDLNLLHSLGIRLVVVHGCRPQVEAILAAQGIPSRYAHGVRVTDTDAMDCVLEAAGQVRARIEALLSLGLANSPMAGARNRVSSGNYLTAKPMGMVDGVDMQLTGEVRRIDTEAIQQRLDDGDIVLISPIGYSPTGEIFNLTVEEVATQVAVRLEAAKLIFLMDADGVRNGRRQLADRPVDHRRRGAARQRRQAGARRPAATCPRRSARATTASSARTSSAAASTARCCSSSSRATAWARWWRRRRSRNIRNATIDDVGGILALIEPLEEQGVLVRRSRERLESEIERFVVAEYDGHIIGCAALYAFPEEKIGELAALAVQPDFRREGYGEALLREIEMRARKLKLTELFVLTTKTAHWFLERGFRIGNDRRSAAAEAGALQLPAQVAGLPQTVVRITPMARTGSMRQARPRGRGTRFPAVSGRARQAHLRERLEGSVAGWLKHQTMLVNENRLSLADARARKWLAEQMEKHFFGGGAEMPSGYVPPT